jgi:alpha-D-xyloside xylohydrolase
MFGPNIMVNPVYTYKATSRKVYFPGNTAWYDFETGKYITGGQTLDVTAPYERIPLFIREGSILPVGEIIQSTKESQNDLTLYVYEGKNGEFTLYEDEGTNYNYEKGIFSTIRFNYNENTKTLTVGNRQGQYPGMSQTRKFTIKWISKDGKNAAQMVEYSGNSLRVNR